MTKKDFKPPNLESKSFKIQLGKKIKKLRLTSKLTQEQVRVYLGYSSTGMLSLIENGRTNMSMDQIYSVSKLFKVHPFSLLTEDDLNDEDLNLFLNVAKITKQKTKTKYYEAIKKLAELAQIE